MTRQMSSVWLYRSEGIQAPDHARCRLSQQDRDCCTLSMLSPDQYPSKITNIYAIKALDTLRCMQLRSASLRIDVCADRARSSASNVFFAPSYLGMPWLSLLSALTRLKRWQGNDTLTALLGHSAFPVDHGRLLLVSGLRSGAKLLPALRVRKAEMIGIFIRLYQIGLSRILSATSHSRKRKREEGREIRSSEILLCISACINGDATNGFSKGDRFGYGISSRNPPVPWYSMSALSLDNVCSIWTSLDGRCPL